jgi:hypothetical protein
LSIIADDHGPIEVSPPSPMGSLGASTIPAECSRTPSSQRASVNGDIMPLFGTLPKSRNGGHDRPGVNQLGDDGRTFANQHGRPFRAITTITLDGVPYMMRIG